jgi:hypothetical protein
MHFTRDGILWVAVNWGWVRPGNGHPRAGDPSPHGDGGTVVEVLALTYGTLRLLVRLPDGSEYWSYGPESRRARVRPVA